MTFPSGCMIRSIVAHPSENPLVYLAMDMPATSVFVPFLASTLKEASKVRARVIGL